MRLEAPWPAHEDGAGTLGLPRNEIVFHCDPAFPALAGQGT